MVKSFQKHVKCLHTRESLSNKGIEPFMTQFSLNSSKIILTLFLFLVGLSRTMKDTVVKFYGIGLLLLT